MINFCELFVIVLMSLHMFPVNGDKQLECSVVSIRLKHLEEEGFGFGHICSGSIISPTAVLTTAECLKNHDTGDFYSKKRLRVVTGECGRSQQSVNTQIFDVAKVKIHTKFDDSLLANNIAVLKLAREITLNNSTAIAEIAAFAAEPEAICASLGLSDKNIVGVQANYLIRDHVILQDEEACFDYFGYSYNTNIQICAFSLTKGHTCMGDTGGPLICDKKVQGILSQRADCQEDLPDVFTRVPYFYAWILRNPSNSLTPNYIAIVLFFLVVLMLNADL